MTAEPIFNLDPATTALVVVDMQNDFCTPGGACADGPWDYTEFNQAIQPNVALVKRAREAGVTVVLTRILHEAGKGWNDAPHRIKPPFAIQRKRSSCLIGSWGGDVVDELKPMPGDIVIDKNMMSSFVGTDLDAQLKARGIHTIVLTGVVTYACVLSTGIDARGHGYNVLMVKDAVGSFWHELNEPVFKIVDLLLGYAVTSEQVVFQRKAAAA